MGWGNAVEISGLPRGKVGVTPWKSRRYPVENLALAKALLVTTLLAYVLHYLIVSNGLCASNFAETHICLNVPNREL